MGLDLDHVLSDSRHHGAFVCAICQRLADLDCLVTSACSHCFCQRCLQIWLDKNAEKASCPTCSRDLLYGNDGNNGDGKFTMMGSRSIAARPLELAQPLAHRLMKSIAVKCPMRHDVGCRWEGDYCDLQAHLLSSTAHVDDSTDRASSSSLPNAPASDANMETEESSPSATQSQMEKQLSLAASLKEEANGRFETNHYREANSLYTKAMSVLEKIGEDAENSTNALNLMTTLYSNRAAANLKIQEYALCLDDCNYVLQKLDANNVKVHVRAIRASVQLGRLETAANFAQRALERVGENPILRKEARHVEVVSKWKSRGDDQLKGRQFADAKTTWSHLLKEAPSAIPFLLGAAASDLGLGLTDSALRLTKRILIRHAQNPQGCWIRGQVLFLMGEYKLGIQLLQEALRLDPDSSEIKASLKMTKRVKEYIETAQRKVFSRQFSDAIDSFTSAIQQYEPTLPPKAPLYASLHTQRAQAHLRLKRYKETLKDCALVLYAQEDHVPAWLLRFQACHGLEDHETALSEARDASSRFPQDERLRKACETADFLSRRRRRTDYYALLGCSSIASEMEIKKAYKRKALELHPDRLPPGSSPEKQGEARRDFQLLGEGLEVLCDDFTRRLYDEGYDAEAIRERVEAAKQAAHRHQGGYHRHSHY